MPRLDERLAVAASLVRPGSRVADIGTDHGKVLIYLAAAGIVPAAIGCDIRPGPLDAARRNVQAAGLSGKIQLRLGDGLAPCSPDEVDDIIIAGMGGENIEGILNRADWRMARHRYILQPMTRARQLRTFLAAAGYEIECERGAVAAGIAYTVMAARYTGIPRPLTALEAVAGRIGEDCSPAAAAYLRRQAAILRKIEEGRRQASGGAENGPGGLWQQLEALADKADAARKD